MFPYLAIFAVTTVLVYLAENARGRHSLVWAAAAVLLLAVFAGLRSSSIGTDTGGYITYGYDLARQHLGDFAAYRHSMPSSEISFLLLEYVAASVGGTKHLVLFILALVTGGFFYAGIHRQKNLLPSLQWLAWMVYCLFFFNLSLNLMRQSAAMAILFDAVSSAPFRRLGDGRTERLWVYATRGGLLVLFAMTWHRTAALGFVFLVFRIIMTGGRRLWAMLFGVLVTVLPALIGPVAQLLYEGGLLPARYSEYLSGSYASHPDVSQITLGAVVLVLLLVYLLVMEKMPACIDSFFFCLFLGFFSFNLLAGQEIIRRCAYYFSISVMYILPSCALLFRTKDKSRNWACAGIVTMLLVYWYMVFVFAGWNQTIPYRIGV